MNLSTLTAAAKRILGRRKPDDTHRHNSYTYDFSCEACQVKFPDMYEAMQKLEKSLKATDEKIATRKALAKELGEACREVLFALGVEKYSPDQPRDESGKWTDGGGDASASGALPGTIAPSTETTTPRASGAPAEPSSADPVPGQPSPEEARAISPRLKPVSFKQYRTLWNQGKDWKEKIAGLERQAVKFYSTDKGYKALNDCARKSLGCEGVADKLSKLDSALSKGSIPETVTVYRGVQRLSFDKINEGGTFTDHGFSSTTARLNTAKTFAGKNGTLMAITIPKGSAGAYIDHLSEFAEQEILLPRRQSYRIDRKESRGGRQILHVTLLGAAR